MFLKWSSLLQADMSMTPCWDPTQTLGTKDLDELKIGNIVAACCVNALMRFFSPAS